MSIRCSAAAALAVLALSWAGHGLAQTPATVVADLPKATFQALQSAIRRKTNGQWAEAEARAIRSAVIQDGKLEASEAAALAELRKGAFSFTIRARPDPSFAPSDVVLKGTLTAAGLALLEIKDADLSNSVDQRAGESRVEFLLRRGADKAAELVQLVASDSKARTEARALIARRFSSAYDGGMARGGVPAAVSALQEWVKLEAGMGTNLPAAQKAEYDGLLQEAAVLSSREKSVALIFYTDALGSGMMTDEAEKAIAARIGLK